MQECKEKEKRRYCMTEQREKFIRKTIWIVAAILLLFTVQAVAESEQVIPAEPHATEEPMMVSAANDECLHINLYQTSDNQTRCEYRNSTFHITVTYHKIECMDCRNYFREVIVSEVVGYHNYVDAGDRCDLNNMQHYYWQRCTGCDHETETTVYCRGIHEIAKPNKHEDTDEN